MKIMIDYQKVGAAMTARGLKIYELDEPAGCNRGWAAKVLERIKKNGWIRPNVAHRLIKALGCELIEIQAETETKLKVNGHANGKKPRARKQVSA